MARSIYFGANSTSTTATATVVGNGPHLVAKDQSQDQRKSKVRVGVIYYIKGSRVGVKLCVCMCVYVCVVCDVCDVYERVTIIYTHTQLLPFSFGLAFGNTF